MWPSPKRGVTRCWPREFDNTVQNNLANKAAMVGHILSADRTHIAVLGHQRLVE
jgi:hypothetical protein